MKKYLIIPALTIASFFFTVQCSLFQQEDCVDNLTPYFNSTITYTNHEILEFVNDSGITKFDTVKITYPNIDDTYVNDNTDDDNRSCGGVFYVEVGDYEINGGQATNFYNNTFGVIIRICNRQINLFEEHDTVEYVYNGTTIPSIYVNWSDTIAFPWPNFCSEIYFSASDLRLLKYSVTENNVQTNWRLK
jgi:hypothetical protein